LAYSDEGEKNKYMTRHSMSWQTCVLTFLTPPRSDQLTSLFLLLPMWRDIYLVCNV